MKIRSDLHIFTIFLILSVIVLFPLLLNLGSSAYGPANSFHIIWRWWWARTQGVESSFTPLVGAPSGSSVLSIADPPITFALGYSLTALVGEVAAQNLLVFISFPLTAIFTYLLAYHLTKNRVASFVASLIFTFSPYRFNHLTQVTLISTQYIPLFVLFILKLEDSPSLKISLLAAFSFALVFLSDFYYGFFAVTFALIFVFLKSASSLIFERILPPVVSFFGYYLLAFSLAIIFVIPPVLPMLKSAFSDDRPSFFSTSLDEVMVQTARPWDYFLPHETHPILGQFSRRVYEQVKTLRPSDPWFYSARTSEKALFPGVTTLVLTGVAFFFWFRKDRGNYNIPALLLVALAAFVFSFPSDIFLGSDAQYHFLFPSFYLHRALPMFRTFARFGVLTLLCLSLLAAFGLAYTLRRIKEGGLKKAVFAAALLLISFEFLNSEPLNLAVFDKTPQVYTWLAEQSGSILMAEYPSYFASTAGRDRVLGLRCLPCLFFQRVHGRRLYGPEQMLYFDTSRELDSLERFKMNEPFDEDGIENLVEAGVNYYVIHLRGPLRRPFLPYPKAFSVEIPKELPQGMNLVKEFPDALVYQLSTGEL